ncbi:hypothetical protein TWF192_010720 [Orbilia oligospora]|uniref:Uncharacterized protein n=1 Tax=Orbilia oligospora TaxID=2813651 RepID=A0A6G1LZ19_ORBOL|nr:hypothetical protein TWF191_003711 [Orbilia oligospora]KAF3237965.1 hypothetical protein TWF192_010720 [Orbilia oligospora]
MESLALNQALEGFKTSSQRERIQFLNALFDSFLPSEKYALQEKLRTANCYFDIFGFLPVEISLQIAEDLDPKDIIRLRRVSLRWKSLLSSSQLAKKITYIYYAKRSDLHFYARQLEEDPFSALRNIAFKEYSGESGLFKLKTGYDFSFSGIPQDGDGFFVALKVSVGLEYAIFGHTRQGSLPETYQWYLVDLNRGQSQTPAPLVNKRREILDKRSAHVGAHCAAAVTLNSNRALVWNRNGRLIREFKLLHEGGMTISSSEDYMCIRNEHGDTDYSDYYLVNLQTAALRVFERVTDFVKAATREGIINSPPMMILAYRITVAAVFLDSDHKPQVCASWLTFHEEEGTLIETTAGLINHDLPGDLPNPVLQSISFCHSINATGVRISGLETKERNVRLAILSGGEVSASWKCFDQNPLRYQGLSPGATASFYYKDTFYTVMPPATEEHLSEDKNYLCNYSLWCSKGDQLTPLGPGRVLELVGMSGQLEGIRPHDKGFAVFYRGGVHVYDWLSFDEFMDPQKSK